MQHLSTLDIELKELEKANKKQNRIPNITIKIDANCENPHAVLRSELEHARDIAKGTVPDQKVKHFSRYDGMNESEVASGYVHKKSIKRNIAIQNEKTINNIQSRNTENIKNGYQFNKEANLDYENGQRIKIKNSEGQDLGYVDYTIEGDVLHIQQVTNTTKRKINWKTQEKLPKKGGEVPSTPNVANKLIDNLISENPDLKIQWDAVTQDGRKFKERYLKENPSLANKVQGFSTAQEVDTAFKNDYNNQKSEVDNETGNISERQRRDRVSMGKDTISNDNSTSGINSQQGRKPISNSEGNILESNSRVDSRGNITNTNLPPQQLKFDFNSIDDVAEAAGKGDFKYQTAADVDRLGIY